VIPYNVSFKTLWWSQTISQDLDDGGVKEDERLSLVCEPESNCKVTLSNGDKLRDYKILLNIVQGELYEPIPEDALGRLSLFAPNLILIDGYLYLKPAVYSAVWKQVRQGRYDTCQIDLGLDPIHDNDVWKVDTVSIVTASLTFNRRTADFSANQQTQAES
jgi:hypothetical protein